MSKCQASVKMQQDYWYTEAKITKLPEYYNAWYFEVVQTLFPRAIRESPSLTHFLSLHLQNAWTKIWLACFQVSGLMQNQRVENLCKVPSYAPCFQNSFVGRARLWDRMEVPSLVKDPAEITWATAVYELGTLKESTICHDWINFNHPRAIVFKRPRCISVCEHVICCLSKFVFQTLVVK